MGKRAGRDGLGKAVEGRADREGAEVTGKGRALGKVLASGGGEGCACVCGGWGGRGIVDWRGLWADGDKEWL